MTAIGQQFDAPRYFWGRLSATTPNPYNAGSSGGSNLGPTNPALADEVKTRVSALHDADPDNSGAVPVDLVTSSGSSGLDPDIRPAAVAYQVARVAKARGMTVPQVEALVEQANSQQQKPPRHRQMLPTEPTPRAPGRSRPLLPLLLRRLPGKRQPIRNRSAAEAKAASLHRLPQLRHHCLDRR